MHVEKYAFLVLGFLVRAFSQGDRWKPQRVAVCLDVRGSFGRGQASDSDREHSLIQFCTILIRFDTILIRFDTDFIQFDTILIRFDTRLID